MVFRAGRARIVLQLLTASESRLVCSVLYAIPLIFCLVFYSFLTGSKVLLHFENFMQQSYIGIMGELTVNSPSEPFLLSLYQSSSAASLNASPKQNLKKKLVIRSDTAEVAKGVDLHIYSRAYLKSKFSWFQNGDYDIVLNSVLANQLGIDKSSGTLRLYDPDSTTEVSFASVLVVDLGFLISDPVIILDSNAYEQLTKTAIRYNRLEFHQLPIMGEQKVTELAEKAFRQDNYASYKVIDTKTLTSEHRNFFSDLNLYVCGLFTVLILLSLQLNVLAINTVLTAKIKSIKIIRQFGLESCELWSYTVLFTLVMITLSFLLSYIVANLTLEPILTYMFN